MSLLFHAVLRRFTPFIILIAPLVFLGGCLHDREFSSHYASDILVRDWAGPTQEAIDRQAETDPYYVQQSLAEADFYDEAPTPRTRAL